MAGPRLASRSGGENVHHDPSAVAPAGRRIGNDARNLHAVADRAGLEPTGVAERVAQCLPRRELVDGLTHHLARDLDARAVHRHEHDVTALELDIM